MKVQIHNNNPNKYAIKKQMQVQNDGRQENIEGESYVFADCERLRKENYMYLKFEHVTKS